MLFGAKPDQNIRIKLNNETINRVSNSKFLGVIIDDKLSWDEHAKAVASKVSRSIGILNKASKSLPRHILTTIYSTIVLPHLQYCNVVWAKNYRNRLESIFLLQKKAIRIVNHAGYYDHTAPLFKNVNQMTIFDINMHQIGSFMHQLAHANMPTTFNHILNPRTNIHHHNPRNKNLLNICHYKTIQKTFSISVAGPTLWNSLEPNLKNKKTIHSFKRAFKKSIIASY